jgi:hypothetical protein
MKVHLRAAAAARAPRREAQAGRIALRNRPLQEKGVHQSRHILRDEEEGKRE